MGNRKKIKVKGAADTSEKEMAKTSHGCKCDKSKCLKMYCECYKAHRYCGSECNCKLCCNRERQPAFCHKRSLRLRPKAVSRATKGKTKDRHNERLGCTCKKIRCNKKYCECYLKGRVCDSHCKCIGCLNTHQDLECHETLNIQSLHAGSRGYRTSSVYLLASTLTPAPGLKACLQDFNCFQLAFP